MLYDYKRNKIKSYSSTALYASDIGKDVIGYITYDSRYNGKNKNEWKLLYADGEHIYLMTKYIVNEPITNTATLTIATSESGQLYAEYNNPLQKISESVAVKNGLMEHWKQDSYVSNYITHRGVAFMLDDSKWSSFANDSRACWAIGSPTLELYQKAHQLKFGGESYCMSSYYGSNQYANYFNSYFLKSRKSWLGWFIKWTRE